MSSPSEWLRLRSANLSAEIDPAGAQLSVLQDVAGRDLLWDGNPAVWNGRAPLLFPIVGMLAGGTYRMGSKAYALSRHGFARGRMFEVVEATSRAALLRLGADTASLKVYPFRFELDVQFELSDASLSITTAVRNRGDGLLPASFGYHPAFRWPLPFGQDRAAHFIEFETDEPAPIRRLNSQGLLAAAYQPTPVRNRRLALTDDLFTNDVIIFDQFRSRSVTYGAEQGPRLKVSFPDAPYLGVWTKPGAQFVCIEPWHGVSDPEGFTGDFTSKPGVFVVPAGSAMRIEMTVSVL